MNESDMLTPMHDHQPVNWELMTSLGLYANTDVAKGPVQSPLSPMSDMLSGLPSAGSSDTPLPGATALHPSNSVRSQRNWSEYDGHPVSPLPSPLIRSVLDDDDPSSWQAQQVIPSSPTEELTKTQAFFSASAAAKPPPKPPRNLNIARSASSRAPSSAVDTIRRRQRALSSPHQPQEPLRMETLTVPSSLEVPQTNNLHERPFNALPVERKASRPISRHVHGPSMNVTNDSIMPTSPPPTNVIDPDMSNERPLVHSPTGQEPVTAHDNEQLLQSVDIPTEREDEKEGLVGPYHVLSRLGTGAFSKVLLAEPLSQERKGRVALKMIACEPWKIDKRMRVSWIREVEVLKHISHPSIVAFVDSFRTPQHYTLVLDAVDGGELFDLLSRHQADIAQREWLVRRIFGELAAAVGWMHENNLVHRDIKLENIMMTRTLFSPDAPALVPSALGPVPLIKVTDFGLARFIHPDQMLETRCGSEEYAAPELIIGKKYDGRKTDAWALGVVLYVLLTGGLPFLESPQTPQDPPDLQEEREKQHGGNNGDRDAKLRKAHLLRIAKGELRWPEHANDRSETAERGNYEKPLRLVTPQARHIASRFLRRDANRRAACWDLWKDPWFLYGSFVSSHDSAPAPLPLNEATMLCPAEESSAAGERVPLSYNPLSERGRKWIESFTATRSENAPPMHRDLPP